MTKFMSALTLSVVLASQAHGFGVVPAGPHTSIFLPGATQSVDPAPQQSYLQSDAATPRYTQVSRYHPVVSVTQIEVQITTLGQACDDGANGWADSGACFYGILPDGEVVQFFEQPTAADLQQVIQGYSYAGPQVITVEHVIVDDYTNCAPVVATMCYRDRYGLVTH